jgi:hypothetical protein
MYTCHTAANRHARPRQAPSAQQHVVKAPPQPFALPEPPLTPPPPPRRTSAAAVHAAAMRTPLSAPPELRGSGSHTGFVSLPLVPPDLYGTFTVIGPARLRVLEGGGVLADVSSGGAVDVMCSAAEGFTRVDAAHLSHDGDAGGALCRLWGRHLELQGAYKSPPGRGTRHGSTLVLTVDALPPGSEIELLAGASASHPIRVVPQPH